MSYLFRKILPVAALLALVALPAHGEDSRIERAKKIRDQILAKRAVPAEVDRQNSRQHLEEDAREDPFADALEAARKRLAGIDAELEANRRKSEGLSAPREKLAAREVELTAMAARLEEQSRRRAEAIYRSARLGSQAAGWGAGEASSARLSRYLAAIAGAEQQNLAKIEVERGSIVASLDRIRADEATVVAERRALEADRGEAEAAARRATEDTEVRPDAEVAAIAARERDEAPAEEEDAGDNEEADNAPADATAADVESLEARARADSAGSAPLRNGGTLASENRALSEAAALMRLEEARAKLAARSRDEHIAQDKAGAAAGSKTPGAQAPEDFSWPGTGHASAPAASVTSSANVAAPAAPLPTNPAQPAANPTSPAVNLASPAATPATPAAKTAPPAVKPAAPATAPQAAPTETASAAKSPTDAKPSEAKSAPADASQKTPPPAAVAAVPAPASTEGDKPAAAPAAGEPTAAETSAAPSAPADASAPAKPRGFLSRLFSGAGDRESDKFAASRGALAPPVAGKVVANYGQQHKSGATYRGVVLRAAHNAPIRAVADGKVSFVGDVPGMGKTVIVSHGNRYHTVYARLGSVDVKEGEKVTSGTEVGALPDNDADMQFELRDQGTAVDPLPWLRGAAPGIAR
ncbi:MAG TPA: peptidoglycan DD-metalloendopeptidase family protein [Candidatus Limnocylindrales bacterium]|nr:peptidoglycan DD-metalloendopeptidase family protein [Candidatus Limnocylindrales bacterium]